jgi:hypothetical protein
MDLVGSGAQPAPRFEIGVHQDAIIVYAWSGSTVAIDGVEEKSAFQTIPAF